MTPAPLPASVLAHSIGGLVPPGALFDAGWRGEAFVRQAEAAPPWLVGMAVHALFSLACGDAPEKAFAASLKGAAVLTAAGVEGAGDAAAALLASVRGLDNDSAEAAIRLCTFEPWYRGSGGALVPSWDSVPVSRADCAHSVRMAAQAAAYALSTGPVATATPFSCERASLVSAAESDFCADGCVWEIKCSRKLPSGSDVAQACIYLVLGVLEGKPSFDGVRGVGVVNPGKGEAWRAGASDIGWAAFDGIMDAMGVEPDAKCEFFEKIELTNN